MLAKSEILKCRLCKQRKGAFIGSKTKSVSKNKTLLYLCCNFCQKQRLKKYRKNNPEKIKGIVARYEKNNKHKRSAWNSLAHGKRMGYVKSPERCERCHKPVNVQGHHADYSKPLEVQWLCVACHNSVHK